MDFAERAKLKAQLRQQVEDEYGKRAREHRVKVHTINARRRYRKANKLKAAKQPLDFLAIGDSWFDYPLNDYGIPWPNQDIVAKLKTIGNPHPIGLSLAVHGNPMTTTMGLADQMQYVSDLADSSQWVNGSPDAILVSGGGDDVVGDQFIIYLDYFGGGLSSRIQGAVDSVEASYQALFDFRNLYAPDTPIFGHCYDYAIPNGMGVFFQGPWLQPPLNFAHYDYAQGLTIVQNAIDRLYAMLNGLASVKKNKYYLVDTRGTLTRDSSQPLGWANEIHPYSAGFLALAQKFVPVLQSVFPGRI
ncbi:MAG TPA: SGNH/GDSL hydrolase family protein [Roseiarcus sp.]|jgi:hypothetical protein|nr:SGNH/GDSL hydrolase family protein [Roseiarcus sp.]